MKSKTTMQNLYFIRQSPFVLISRIISLELLFLFIYIFLRLPKFLIPDSISDEVFFGWSLLSLLIFFIINIGKVIILVFTILNWVNEYYIVKPTDIVHRQGVLTIKEETFSLKNVESFTVNQSFIEKLFNYGSIKFYSPVLKQDYFLTNIPKPIDLKEKIEENIDLTEYDNEKSSGVVVSPRRR